MLHKPVKRTYQRVDSMGENRLPRFHYTAVGLMMRFKNKTRGFECEFSFDLCLTSIHSSLQKCELNLLDGIIE